MLSVLFFSFSLWFASPCPFKYPLNPCYECSVTDTSYLPLLSRNKIPISFRLARLCTSRCIISISAYHPDNSSHDLFFLFALFACTPAHILTALVHFR